VIETARLILRPWRDEDREPFRAMSADPEIMATLGGVLSAEAADAYIERHQGNVARLGFGRWAVERRDDGAFIGAVGLAPIWPGLPLPEGYEMGWRLVRPAWGAGYAAEAARAAIDDALTRRGLAIVYAFTAHTNTRSEAVMRRLGMSRRMDLDFEHPDLPPGDPLRRHVVYVAARNPSPPACGGRKPGTTSAP
jgi:RimJ/RimL family protein N-acetyltransferase